MVPPPSARKVCLQQWEEALIVFFWQSQNGKNAQDSRNGAMPGMRAFVMDIRTFVAEDNAELQALMQNIQEVMSDSDNK